MNFENSFDGICFKRKLNLRFFLFTKMFQDFILYLNVYNIRRGRTIINIFLQNYQDRKIK